VTPGFLAILTLLGFGGALVAGLLGVGGAIIMIPLLLYGPPWLGFPPLPMRTVAAVSMVQVLFAALSGAIAHGRRGRVHRELALTAGALSALGSLLGGILSGWTPTWFLQAVFAVMATAGAALMALTLRDTAGDDGEAEGSFTLRRPIAALVGAGVGMAAGLVGAGGAFLLVPLLITVVGVPTRITIGSSLAITLWTAVAGVAGKLITGQVPLLPAAALVLEAVPGAQCGEWISRRLGPRALRGWLAAITTLVALRVWFDVYLVFR
jgi:uncharacterized membrane protein YfcA